jgi:hypothetical protein
MLLYQAFTGTFILVVDFRRQMENEHLPES